MPFSISPFIVFFVSLSVSMAMTLVCVICLSFNCFRAVSSPSLIFGGRPRVTCSCLLGNFFLGGFCSGRAGTGLLFSLINPVRWHHPIAFRYSSSRLMWNPLLSISFWFTWVIRCVSVLIFSSNVFNSFSSVFLVSLFHIVGLRLSYQPM